MQPKTLQDNYNEFFNTHDVGNAGARAQFEKQYAGQGTSGYQNVFSNGIGADGRPINPSFGSSPVTATTPTDPTIASAMTSAGVTQDQYTTDAQIAANTPVDENAIRQQTLDRIQSEINAQNLVYDDMVRKAQQTGKEQLQQAGVIQARRGLLGSDFGASQNNVVQAGTNESLNSIETQRGAAISAIRAKANTDATAEIAAKRAAREKGHTEYLAFLAGQNTRNTESAKNAVKAFIYGGHKLDDATATELAKKYGQDVPTIQAMYGDLSAELAPKPVTPIKVGDSLVNPQTGEVIYASPADINSKRFITLADGATLYDTQTKSVVAQNAKDYNPNASTGQFTPYQQFQATQALAKDTQTRTAGAREIARQANIMNTALTNFKSGTGDKNIASQAIISTFNKILDPTSVVRESEYDRTAAGQSLITALQGKIENITQGGAGVTEATLQSAVDLANQYLQASQASLLEQNKRAETIASQFGLNPSLVTTPTPPQGTANDPLGVL